MLFLLVFIQYSLIIWRRPGGSAGESVTPEAHSRPTRKKINVSRGLRKTIKKNIDFWMPFCLHFGSIWHPNWLHFGIIFRFSFWAYFRCVFFGKLQHFRSRKSSILVLSPRRRAIFRVFIKLQTNPKRTQHLSKMAPKINQKTS